MVGQESDWAGAGSRREFSRTDQLALALDGTPPTACQRAVNAYRASLQYDRTELHETLERLRRWSPHAIAVVSSKLSSTWRLLQILEVPHVVVDSLLEIPKQSSIVVLGCQNAGSVSSNALRQVLARGVTVVTSDKSALAEPFRDVLAPDSARPSRVARLRWTDYTGVYPPEAPGKDLLFSGVHLPPGYVPVSPLDRPGSSVDVLAVDSLTGEPLVVRASISRGMLVHSVPHWWQQHGVARTALDRRRLVDIPVFDVLGSVAGDVTLGEFQAARTMTAALLRALRPMLE